MPSKQISIPLDPATRKNVDLWLEGDYDAYTKSQIQHLLQTNPQEIIDAFYTQLTFGTGGLRGIMGVGSNRMNVYTVRAAAQGLANYLRKQNNAQQPLSAIIGYDSRKHSREFAEESAKVLAGNGITVFLFSEMRPTPLLAFGCRFKKCSAGIMITASHNPADYNGFKVYWSDGGQAVYPHDKGIIAEFQAITSPGMVRSSASVQDPLINPILGEIDEAYFKAIKSLQNYPRDNKNFGHVLKWVYTSLHGTGITVIPRALEQWGFLNPILVEPQVIPDSSFPTVPYPNPEDPQVLKLGVELMESKNADLLIATDPDADRVGVAVKHKGQSVYLSGNQVACICLEHLCKALSDQKRLPLRAVFMKTIVTTELFRAIAEAFQRKCYDAMIGSKYIAQQIALWEEQPNGPEFLFGAEDSLGYLLGNHVREKDAVAASALICEAALQAKLKGKSMVDMLHDLYMKHGVYADKQLSVKFPETKEGRTQIDAAMERLRKSPPENLCGIGIAKMDDYRAGSPTNLKADILSFWLVDGSKITVRPSGTEPKIKLYCETVERDFKNLQEAIKACNAKAESLLKALEGELI